MEVYEELKMEVNGSDWNDVIITSEGEIRLPIDLS